MPKKILVEYDTNHDYGPASEQHVEKWETALSMGMPYFLYPYFGYHLKMMVKNGPDEAVLHSVQTEKASG